MAITSKNPITGYDAAYAAQQKRTYQESLEDLRDDDEFVKIAERFLTSTEKGESLGDHYAKLTGPFGVSGTLAGVVARKVADKKGAKKKVKDPAKQIFQYFRGADWNIKDVTAMALDVPNFTEEQKKDFNYLRNRFNRARVGGAGERYQLTVDAGQELLSDPINWLSALLIPWTGTTSIGARLAGGETAKQALKQTIQSGTKLTLRQKGAKAFLNAPGQVMDTPLSTKQILKIASAEGFLYGGTHNYVYQSIDLAAGERTQRDYLETVAAAGIGAVAAPAIIGGLKGIGGLPKYINSVNEQRISKIDNHENYQSTWFEEGASSLVEGAKFTAEKIKLYALPLRPTTFLRKKAKENVLLQDLLKLVRYDAMEGFIAPALGKQKLLRADYNMQLNQFWGRKSEKLNKILGSKGWNLRTSQNRFTSKDRKNFLMNPGLSDSVNNDLAYVIRSGKSFKIINKEKVKIDANIVGAGKEIRKELDTIYNQAVKVGLKPNRADNYFPRWWRTDVIKKNKSEFIDKIIKAEKLTYSQAEVLWKNLVTEGTPERSVASGLSSRLNSQRILNKLDDAEFGKFLNNDIEGVLKQYYAEASSLITRTKLFGETTEDFVAKWIKPIEKSGLKLKKREVEYLKDLYEIVTGQQGRIKNKAGAFLHDIATVSMQTSMLGLATLTSFAEIGVPLLLGTEARLGSKSIVRSISDSGKEWWGTQKQNFGVGDPNVDIRPVNRQDLNSFMTSVNLAAEDRAVAIYGQAMGKRATKIQNFFFKTIGLHDWTRFVQLVGYDTGKNIIAKNLKTIADNPTAKGSAKKSDAYILRLKDELAELNINYNSGLNWLKRGGLHTDRFFMQDVRAGAVRYTNEVVMNPTAASAQKPLVHSKPATRWAYGLMGFPTAFANGPLRKVVRNMTKDAHTMSAGGLRISTPRAVTGSLFMASVGLLNYTLRTRGQNFKDLESGKITEYELLERSLQYAGLLGPGEYYVRYYRAEEYESKIAASISSFIGPNLPDLIEYGSKFWDKGVLAETVIKRAPFSVALKSLHREKYDEWLKWAREKDKNSFLASSGPDEKVKKGESLYREDELSPLATGGLVEGEDNVPYTKENPADRINPYTGEPYQRKQKSIGGVLARQLIRRSPHLSESAKQTALNKITAKPINSITNPMDIISSRGSSDKDKLGEFINLYAKDDEGMYSTAVKSLIEDTPDNLKGKGLAQFINSKKFTSKVKDEELNILNLNKYIDENPQASLEEVIEYAGQNKTVVKTSVYSDSVTQGSPSKTELFLEAEPVSADKKLFMVTGKGKMQSESYVPVYTEDLQNVQALVNKNDVDIANDLIQIAQKDFKINLPANLSPLEKLSELKRTRQYPEIENTLAKQIYEVDPIQKIVPNPEMIARIDEEYIDRAFDVYALRSRDGTYRIYASGEDMTPRIMGDRDIPQVEGKGYVLTNEAETKVQMQSFLEEEGLLKELSEMYEPKWKYIIDENMPGGSNYREFVFNNDNAKIPSVFKSDHFPEEKNYIAHALVRNRKFQDGSTGLHIDELQSDLHQKGSKYGYATPESIDKLDKEYAKLYSNYIEKYKPFEKEMRQELLNMIESYPNNKGPKKLLSLFDKVNTKILKAGDANSTNSFKAHQDLVDFIFYNDLIQLGRSPYFDPRKFLNEARNRTMNLSDNRNVKRKLVPNSPFKETWHQLSIKKLLKRAVDEGYDNLSISNSKPIVKRYEGMGEEGKELFYDRKVKNYMQKLAKSTGGEFKIKYLENDSVLIDFRDPTGNTTSPKDIPDELLRSYVIEITPELKELVSTKGLASFRKGGKVSTNEQMDRLGFDKGGDEPQARMQEINIYLKGKGYSKEARAGIIANIGVETGYTYDPKQKQINGKGYGLFQLDAKREDYNNWMAERNFKEDKINNMAAQLEYMHDTIQTGREIGGGNANTLQKSFNEKSAEDIAVDFSNIWEKPVVPHLDRRINMANKLLNVID